VSYALRTASAIVLKGNVGGARIIGNFAVLGLAGLRYYGDACHNITGDCLQNIPFWWLPVSLLLLSIPVKWVEKFILSWREPPAGSP
jgi:hypothetical protein